MANRVPPFMYLFVMAGTMVFLTHMKNGNNEWKKQMKQIEHDPQQTQLDPREDPFTREIQSEHMFIHPRSSSCHMEPFNVSRAVVDGNTVFLKNARDIYQSTEIAVNKLRDVASVLNISTLPTPKPGDTCVVLGSSGIFLAFPNLGEVIDRYDHVIRLNFAPTEGYEQFVGTKTSFMVGYHSSMRIAIENNRTIADNQILFASSYAMEFESLSYYLKNDSRIRPSDGHRYAKNSSQYSAMRNFILTNKISLLSRYTRSWVQKKVFRNTKIRPTTGLEAIVIIMNWCPTPVDIGGFGFVNSPNVPYHYFDQSYMNNGIHFPKEEHKMFRNLLECGRIGQDLTGSIGRV